MSFTVESASRPLHRARMLASFALLGALLAGVTGMVLGIEALSRIDLHEIGAVLGAIFGVLAQGFRR